ncbi:hypothetical protein B0H17DRAFT_1140360 [Mycena rosella]|uniref:Uncharacterized protein n=1 Tax=Mycena rosella TaxID=1033263 RepID=A0AAD7D251_MYCRO|nr:hypothetical protein B0H17DRAFT_1140360 [Mycena rosella]
MTWTSLVNSIRDEEDPYDADLHCDDDDSEEAEDSEKDKEEEPVAMGKCKRGQPKKTTDDPIILNNSKKHEQLVANALNIKTNPTAKILIESSLTIPQRNLPTKKENDEGCNGKKKSTPMSPSMPRFLCCGSSDLKLNQKAAAVNNAPQININFPPELVGFLEHPPASRNELRMSGGREQVFYLFFICKMIAGAINFANSCLKVLVFPSFSPA